MVPTLATVSDKKGTPLSFRLRYLLAFIFILSTLSPALVAAQTSSSTTPETHHGIDLQDMDLSVNPEDDFYRFANGGWLDRTEIPDTEGSYGVFNELAQKTDNQLVTLLVRLATDGGLIEGSDNGKRSRRSSRVWM